MNKIRHYFSTLEIIRGLTVSVIGSAFIYLNHWGLSYPLVNTILGLLSIYILLDSNPKTWFISGSLFGLLWFWWISLSLIHYEMLWAVPLELIVIMLSYGLLFGVLSKLAHLPLHYCKPKTQTSSIFKYCSNDTIPYIMSLVFKSMALLILSYIHPFGFDWLKPELIFVESYLGIEKWQFLLILMALSISIVKHNILYAFLVILAYQPTQTDNKNVLENIIKLVTTQTKVQDKWNEKLHPKQFSEVYTHIEQAIKEKKEIIIFPESIFPIFLNHSEEHMVLLQKKSKHIAIVIGGLYWDGQTPRNSTYIFENETVRIANKVILVPFGEVNPLPDFLSDWVNEVFYDGAIDYKADENVIDYKIGTTTYRNAICFEGTSEKLYSKNHYAEHPKNMILLSNNGWFTPSTEPTLQKLLLQYYSKKYGTTIYHAVNMSSSYIVQNGVISIP